MIRKIGKFSHTTVAKREKIPSQLSICISVCVYFFGALALHTVDHAWLLTAWLMAGPLLYTVYLTRDAQGSLLNPYTLFFTVAVMISLGCYVVTHLTV